MYPFMVSKNKWMIRNKCDGTFVGCMVFNTKSKALRYIKQMAA